MTFLAGREAVARMHRGSRIVGSLNSVAAVAVIALGRIRIAQRVHLPMVGPGVGFQVVGVTAATVGGDRELGIVLRWICDVVGGVAIGADGRTRIPVVQDRLAVHRGRVLLALARMTFAADVRDAEPPLGALVAAGRVDVVRGMAVVAACVDARLVVPLRACMDRLQVVVDLLDHDAQSCVLPGRVRGLGGFPQRVMAGHAVDGVRHALLVRDFGDVLVTVDATALAMDAVCEPVLDHVQRAGLAIRALDRKSFVAVTAEAAVIGGVTGCGRRGRRVVRGVCGLGQGLLLPGD